MSIPEFLLARIAEDEAEAAEYQSYEDQVYETAGWFEPTRVLRECAAKRAIIEQHEPAQLADGTVCLNCRGEEEDEWFREPWPCTTIRALAAVYSDHPDYQPEWAPN